MKTQIHSIKEDVVVEARALHSSAKRLETGTFLIDGEQQILWALSSPSRVLHVFVHDKEQNHPLVKQLEERGIPIYVATDGILKKISDTSYLVPFVGVVQADKAAPLHDPFVIVLDDVQDMGNVGTIVRTAAAFGIQEFLATKETFDWSYKKAIDASRGTLFSAHMHRFSSEAKTIAELKSQGYQIAVATTRGSVVQSFAKLDDRPLAVVFGNETSGVSPELENAADIRIQIPMSGAVESLNVGVAAGISLYELKIKWILSMLTKKIQTSIGRDLACASRWIRLVFDKKLKDASPFNADQAILMMILKCDGTSTAQKLGSDAGISQQTDIQLLLQPLLDERLVIETEGTLSLSEKGEETLAKLWEIHEAAENIAMQDVSEKERAIFLQVLKKMMHRCAQVIPFC